MKKTEFLSKKRGYDLAFSFASALCSLAIIFVIVLPTFVARIMSYEKKFSIFGAIEDLSKYGSSNFPIGGFFLALFGFLFVAIFFVLVSGMLNIPVNNHMLKLGIKTFKARGKEMPIKKQGKNTVIGFGVVSGIFLVIGIVLLVVSVSAAAKSLDINKDLLHLSTGPIVALIVAGVGFVAALVISFLKLNFVTSTTSLEE